MMFVRKILVGTMQCALQKTTTLYASVHQVSEVIHCQTWNVLLLKFVVQILAIHLLFVRDHLEVIRVIVLLDMWEILSHLVVIQKVTAPMEILTVHLSQPVWLGGV